MSEVVPVTRRPDLIYDVGMHQGEDTDYYLKKGFRVVAFEADPALVVQCASRFVDEIGAGRLIIVEGAIVRRKPGETLSPTIRFFKNQSVSVWGTVAPDWAERNEHLGAASDVIEVPVVDFSACLQKYGVPHYLKIDIEGMDTACLDALADFKERPAYVSLEAEKIHFDKLVGELDLLVSLGYSSFQAVQQQRMGRQVAPQPSREGKTVAYKFLEGSSGPFGADLPGPWKDYSKIRSLYEHVFWQYRLFGDYGSLSRYFLGRAVRKVYSLATGKPIPGWYDTHARHASANSE